ncbi:MAG: hypothetical protein IKU78_06500 [Paludibacteraceae bacterium]|nr:hypothetical protein [Paludibacteraceae bacterium]
MSGIKEIIKERDGSTTRVTVITEKGSVYTDSYVDWATEGSKNDTISYAIQKALDKDK